MLKVVVILCFATFVADSKEKCSISFGSRNFPVRDKFCSRLQKGRSLSKELTNYVEDVQNSNTHNLRTSKSYSVFKLPISATHPDLLPFYDSISVDNKYLKSLAQLTITNRIVHALDDCRGAILISEGSKDTQFYVDCGNEIGEIIDKLLSAKDFCIEAFDLWLSIGEKLSITDSINDQSFVWTKCELNDKRRKRSSGRIVMAEWKPLDTDCLRLFLDTSEERVAREFEETVEWKPTKQSRILKRIVGDDAAESSPKKVTFSPVAFFIDEQELPSETREASITQSDLLNDYNKQKSNEPQSPPLHKVGARDNLRDLWEAMNSNPVHSRKKSDNMWRKSVSHTIPKKKAK